MFLGIKYRHYNSQRPFGVELEAGNNVSRHEMWEVISKNSHRCAIVTDWGQTISNRHWHIKTDSTCGPKGKGIDIGYEVASYKASGVSDMKHIADIAGKLGGRGVVANPNCGLHIHADASDFTPAQVGVLIAHWVKLELFIFNCVPDRRCVNEYCRSLSRFFYGTRDKHHEPLEVWEAVCPGDLGVYENHERRVALNVMNYAIGLKKKRWKRKTLELRLPEGTFDPIQVENWIRFFVNFVDYCKDQPVPDNLEPCRDVASALQHCGLGHDDNFYIYSPDLFETRRWLLNRCAKYGSVIHGKLDWSYEARNMLNFISKP